MSRFLVVFFKRHKKTSEKLHKIGKTGFRRNRLLSLFVLTNEYKNLKYSSNVQFYYVRGTLFFFLNITLNFQLFIVIVNFEVFDF